MRDIATAQLSGNLTHDPELRALPSGADVASLRVAYTTRRRQGEQWVDHTNYVTVDVYGAQARACAEHLAKGSRVFVTGELDWREWTDQHGQRRETHTLRARQVTFEGARRAQANASEKTTPAATPTPARIAETTRATAGGPVEATDTGAAGPDDLPFLMGVPIKPGEAARTATAGERPVTFRPVRIRPRTGDQGNGHRAFHIGVPWQIAEALPADQQYVPAIDPRSGVITFAPCREPEALVSLEHLAAVLEACGMDQRAHHGARASPADCFADLVERARLCSAPRSP